MVTGIRQAQLKRGSTGRVLGLVEMLVVVCAMLLVAGAAPAAASSTSATPALAALAVQQAKLVASDGAASDLFGSSVAIDGDTAVVGAPNRTVGGVSSAGAAYVMIRSGSTWSLEAELTAPVPSYALFGSSVAIDGDTVLVGAPYTCHSGMWYPGAAYVFTRTGSTWTLQTQLVSPTLVQFAYFGMSVALDGDTALVGAECDSPDGLSSAGAAYVFTRSGSVWTSQAKLVADDPVANAFLGQSVALDGDTALVGSPRADAGAVSHTGAAYVFTRSGAAWTQQAKLTADDAAADFCFGSSVTLDADTALVGAPSASPGDLTGAGAAYVFTRSGAAWAQQARLTVGDATEYDALGGSVVLDGDTALVGASCANRGGLAGVGAAYSFTRSGAEWREQAEMTPTDGADWDTFATGLALSDGTALIGSPRAAVGSDSMAGAAYAYGFVTDSTAPTTTATGLQTSDDAGWTAGSPVTVGLEASDDAGGTGVAALHYTVDGGPEQSVAGTTTSFAVTGDGSHTVTYWAVDAAGNTEEANTGYVNIDDARPTVAVSGADGGWHAGPVTLTFAPWAGPSGVESVEYKLGGGDWIAVTKTGGAYTATVSTEGENTVSYRATNNAGSLSSEGSCAVKIDTTAPRLRLVRTTLPLRVHRGARLNVGLIWDDALSTSCRLRVIVTQHGKSRLAVQSFTLSGAGSRQTVSLPWKLGPGCYDLHLKLYDAAGNRCRASALVVARR